MSLEQRIAQIESFKSVDEVIGNTSITFEDRYIEEYQLDLVMHGDDFDQKKIKQYYSGALQLNKFKTYPYEPGISTTQIINRAIKLKFESLLENLDIGCEDREAIEKVQRLMDR